MKILVLGATGMLGSSIFKFLTSKSNHKVYGTYRDSNSLEYFNAVEVSNLFHFDLVKFKIPQDLFSTIKPDIVINCIGLIKQNTNSYNSISQIEANAYLPHQLARYSNEFGYKLIHFSTDCVFSGKRGYYTERDIPDPIDIYGKSKLLGEVFGKNSLTIRTSIIGHGLKKNKSLIDWFLGQKDCVEGYKNAFFSGLPTNEIAEILNNNIFPNLHLNGLYHLGGLPINKFDLLTLVSKVYKKEINIKENTDFKINRVLISAKFITDFDYCQKDWPSLIKNMHKNFTDE